MNKKGFTLIELLAVIVILAIIALIATPIVLNMIENARKSAAKSSALGYIEAIEYNNYFAELGSDANLPETYTKVTTGNISNINIKLKGKKPDSGTVTINSEGKVTNATLCVNGYTVTYATNDVTDVTKGCSGSSAPVAQPQSFATDDWSVIAANTTSDAYQVGDTRCVALTGLTTTNDNGCNGNFKVRIANKTACTTEESQTACGFVVEFVDVITTHDMNPKGTYKETQYNNGWSVDGYPASSMYNEYFANNATNSLYTKLPSDLQSAIIDTTVVSGHESGVSSNYTSTDKLYLLSTKEVGFDVSYDSAKDETRKLDYYDLGTGDAAKAKRIKQLDGDNAYWWLRSAYSNSTIYFYNVISSGGSDHDFAFIPYSVSPAFRIGIN